MTSNELKLWQAHMGLSELAMAHYLGVPVHTARKWINGTRNPDAAPCRLFAILQRIEQVNPGLHADLISEAVTAAPDPAPSKPKTRGKGKAAPVAPIALGPILRASSPWASRPGCPTRRYRKNSHP